MTDISSHNARLIALRGTLRARGLDGFVVAHTDEHNSEYTPAYAQRLAWLTGFDGSAGMGVVLADKAALYVDGRYTLQVRAQTDARSYVYKDLVSETVAAWIATEAAKGAVIGYDPWLHSEAWVEKTAAALAAVGMRLQATDGNPIDAIWTDQPAAPADPALPYDVAYAGESSEAKRQRLAAGLDAEAAVITALDSIAWLLNIRGTDVHCTPLVVAFAILHADARVDLYMDPAKVTAALRDHLGNAVSLAPKTAFEDGLKAFGGKRVLVDASGASSAVISALTDSGATVVRGKDPCTLPKACKNPVELEGTRQAHVRDGAAVSRFLAWLAREAPKGQLDEILAAEQLHDFRRETGVLKDLSFDTISGAGPNGAIVHYRATPETNRPIQTGELYLVDSGAQYLDGTTDITRTVGIGAVGAEEKDRFTRVLKGHIAIATARFPKGTSGAQLDTLARMPLWQVGLNYGHGTGHGVGCYLGVHEGPQRIAASGVVPLEPGMIVSNEPGYYKTGGYGIRIENLVVVEPTHGTRDEIETYGFETITLAPIDINLVERDLLTQDEADWLNSYHTRVRETLTPLVDRDTAHWLETATQAI
ncbi:aminopeptidase P family protein [Govanella unica]|uniref:Aminopeptidase P family protein n=1 Tax=Govanella unica TaxID=2975056 RepID=A0A9X3TUK6_9PROT|nr:aminopeptidase P family protein [Govania unica]MDA5192485.1 aminopeptidase P family protein [Govania unica]